MSRTSLQLGVALVLSLCCLLPAQQPPPASNQGDSPQEKSLADVAREARQKKVGHARSPVTDEDIAKRSPIPRINLDGVDNFAEISAAIVDYRSKHSKEQTEQAIHDWYDEYDAMLVSAIRNTTESRDRRDSTLFTGYQLCQDSTHYRECQMKYQAEMRGQRHDQLVMRDDNAVIFRVQQTFSKIRSDLAQNNLHYDWFKIRSANGVGSY
jgi:hypothetical protein